MDVKLNKESRTIIELMIADGIISREDAEKYFPELKSKEPKVIIPKFRVGDIIRLKNSYAESKITEISDGYYRGKGWRLDIVAADESDDYELVRQNLAWSEEDDINLGKVIWYVENPAPMVVKDSMLVEWLKTIKERVQPLGKMSLEE